MQRHILGVLWLSWVLLGCPEPSKSSGVKGGQSSASARDQPARVTRGTNEHEAKTKASPTARVDGPRNTKTLGKIKEARKLVTKVAGAMTVVIATSGQVPKDLKALVEDDFIQTSELVDPWGERLKLTRMKAKGHSHQVCSAGPDRRTGTADDVCAVD